MMKRRVLVAALILLLIVGAFAATVFATEAALPSLSVKKNTLELENAVFMNFKVQSENIDNADDIKLLVWESAPEAYVKGTEDAVLPRKITEPDTGYHVFQYDDLAAKDMTKFIYVCAYANVNGTEVYSSPIKFSIVQYAYNTKNKASSSDELKAVLDSMLAYGAAAQIYFDHRTEFLATDTVVKISAVNGKHADGMKTGYYKEGTEFTLTANAPAEGYVFSHWENSAGETVSTDAVLRCTADASDTYTAVYRTAADPLIVVSDTAANAGDTNVAVTISFKNNPGVALVDFNVGFDPDVLTLTELTYNTEFGGAGTTPRDLNSPVSIVWYNGNDNSKGDMVFVTLIFSVSENAPVGKSDITVTYTAGDICNWNEEDVIFDVVYGKITIS